MATRLVYEFGDVFLSMAVPLDELLVALRLLNGIEVLSLHIFNEGDLGRGGIVDLSHERGNGMKLSALSRSPTPLASDDLETVALRSNQDRLEHTALSDGFRQLLNRL